MHNLGLTLASHVSFFFNDTATTEIYTLSLHDALPIFVRDGLARVCRPEPRGVVVPRRSEEHTSELPSRIDLVCRLLLEKKKNTKFRIILKIKLILNEESIYFLNLV